MLINLGMYETMIAEALHFGILFYLSGLLSLLAGLAIVNLHNRWQMDWRVIITVLGWLMTIGGIIRIVLPQVAIATGSTIYSGSASTIVPALIIGTLGAFLSFKGYHAACLTARADAGFSVRRTRRAVADATEHRAPEQRPQAAMPAAATVVVVFAINIRPGMLPTSVLRG